MDEETKLVRRERESMMTVESTALAHDPTWAPRSREPHLRDYLIILRKHQWLILTFLLTVVTVTAIASFKMRPVYEAVARVEIDRESNTVLPFQGMNSDDAYYDIENYLETRSKILTSETVALQTIK